MRRRRSPVLRPATKEDIEAFYGRVRWTFRAIAAELDGTVLGIGGIYYDRNHIVAFSSFRPEMRDHPVTMARAALRIMEFVRSRACVAVADGSIPGAPALLSRLGFRKVQGNLYRWTPDTR